MFCCHRTIACVCVCVSAACSHWVLKSWGLEDVFGFSCHHQQVSGCPLQSGGPRRGHERRLSSVNVILECEEVLAEPGKYDTADVWATKLKATGCINKSSSCKVNPEVAANVLTGIQRLFTIARIMLVPEWRA